MKKTYNSHPELQEGLVNETLRAVLVDVDFEETKWEYLTGLICSR